MAGNFGEVIETKEPNYYFRLEPYRARLREFLEKQTDFIAPAFRRNELLAALEKPLDDLCISRPKSRLTWGIPLPFNEDYVTYVWFDALVNYYSFAEVSGTLRWPPDLQIIGKDILIPAHGVYWPIMLFALDLELPRHLLVHGFWTNSGAKISKSDAKSLVDPVPYVEKFGADALRYFVLREMVLGQDADFSDERFEIRYQSDLGKKLGNLVQRTLSMIGRYREGVIPVYDGFHLTPAENDLRSDAVVEEYSRAVDQFAPHLALQAVWDLVQRANQYVEETAPFKLAKDPAQAKRLDVVLGHLAETVRRLSVLVQAALPETAEKNARPASASTRTGAPRRSALWHLIARSPNWHAGHPLSASRGEAGARRLIRALRNEFACTRAPAAKFVGTDHVGGCCLHAFLARRLRARLRLYPSPSSGRADG